MQVEKRKISVTMRTEEEELNHAHCNGINQMIVTQPPGGNASSRGGSVDVSHLFTASRDRLIKLWQVDYGKVVSARNPM